MYVHIHAHTCTHMYVYIYIYIYVYSYIYMYITNGNEISWRGNMGEVWGSGCGWGFMEEREEGKWCNVLIEIYFQLKKGKFELATTYGLWFYDCFEKHV